MKRFGVFMSAFCITLCVLGLAIGLYTVGYRSRRMMTGDVSSGSYRLENGQLILNDVNGNQTVITTPRESHTAVPLLPAPARMSLHLLRALTILAEKWK